MKTGKSKVINALFLMGFLILLLAGVNSAVYAQEESFFLPEFEPSLSVGGQTLYDAVPPLVIVVDPNPDMQGIKVTGPTAADALAAPEAAASTFSITYIPAGGKDPWDQVCVAFPAAAKTAFNAAAAIWANTLKSSVPITINACWADLGSPSILGYSGGQPQHRNFAGAPKASTWYQDSLANSIAGSDLTPGSFDMNITYNNGFSWYFGTDSNPPVDQYDLVTVAAHEIGHGLNFSGMATYSGGTGSFGYDGSPNVYDTFMESGAGKALTTYTNPSTALGTLLTSNDLWFNGTNAKAANGGIRLKMYAPSTWAGGSSYSHLDYTTFAGTSNSMMVYAVAPGAANHSPGAVTKGLMKDLGWQLATGTSTVPTPQSPSGNITDTTPTYTWTKVTGATQYRYQLLQGTTVIYTKTVTSPVCGATTCSNTPATALSYLAYKWKVQAMVGGVWKAYSPFKTFTVKVPVPTPQSPTGTITDTTPTYKWTKVAGATQYRYQLLQGTTVIYTKTVASSACGASTCSNTPATVLNTLAYKWKVQAAVGTVWSSYSAVKTFTVSAPGAAKAGFWDDAYQAAGMEFYVTTNQANVDNFAVYVDVYVGGVYCDTYKVTHLPAEPITTKNFSFTGSFYASGTFDSSTAAHGTMGLTALSTPCGSVTGGPWDWTATWKNSNPPPAIVVNGAAASLISVPASKGQNSHKVNAD
jgi:hypothetical protein